jgi:hypothetical protein
MGFSFFYIKKICGIDTLKHGIYLKLFETSLKNIRDNLIGKYSSLYI